MRKTITESRNARPGDESGQGWLDVEQIASVEVTSEDPGFPIESAFESKDGPGWRASQGGEQQIRIVFDQPVSLHRIQLRFHEAKSERTQEFTLGWWSGSGGPASEIVRQQWNFSPVTQAEIERYVGRMDGSGIWNSRFGPIISRREEIATLASWRLG